jgi:hypothetical protein
MERAKTVAEPAGAVALAGLLSGAVSATGRNSCAILSGGNVDPNLMDRLLQYGLGASGRHLRLRTELTDRPGALVRLSTIIADEGANIFEVVHHRIGSARSIWSSPWKCVTAPTARRCSKPCAPRATWRRWSSPFATPHARANCLLALASTRSRVG